ncbi:hypothetical protein [Aestuariirhabdus sp. LZHN29]|uniref:hypothetical protein n=1 Tax=Aestuariirhabdus sp. LZHN29 TaxID=3417462 RepID=UPI003CFA9443
MKKHLLLGVALLITPTVNAEEIRVMVGQQNPEQAQLDRPQFGATMVQVEERYGAPMNQKTIGTPPITTWSYERFSVYFEGDRVLRSVLHKKPSSSN